MAAIAMENDREDRGAAPTTDKVLSDNEKLKTSLIRPERTERTF